MVKTITIIAVALKPETDVEEFEQFVLEVASTYVWADGVSHRFAKYETGNMSTQYIFILERNEEASARPQEENERIRAENKKTYPQNQIVEDKARDYIIDWWQENTVTTYSVMD